MLLRLSIIFVFIGVFVLSCQKKPDLAPASDPLSAIEPPPMGATTYNDELKRELALLDDVVNQRIPEKNLTPLIHALTRGDTKALPTDKNSDQAYLVKLFLALPELIRAQPNMSTNRKLWLKAKLYFINRRFVEAATHMTAVLKVEPDFFEARNWRARAIFFLGNPDLAIRELHHIVTISGESSAQGLDALYLIGAITYESNDIEHHRLQIGINAWSKYLKLAEAPGGMTQEITDGLKELNARLKGEKIADNNTVIDPFAPNGAYSAEKNALLKAFSKEELLLALELSDQALKKQFDPDIATIKARILFKTGRHDEARNLYTDITNNNPRYAPGFHYRGMAFMMQGQPKNAIESWQKVIDIDPAYGQAHGLLQRIGVAQKMVAPDKIETH
jgi:tetratricopeptide (TPR) repeat protein